MLRALCVLLFCCVTTLSPLLAAEILVVESYEPSHPWDASYLQALKQRLEPRHHLTFRYLDTKRIPRELFDIEAEKIWQYYQQSKPDLVVIGDDNAITLLARRIAGNGTPVVYLGMNDNPRRNNLYGLPNLTGVLERPLMKRNIREMAEMIPAARKALVLFDSSDVSVTAVEEEFRNQTELKLGNLTVEIKLLGSYSLWQEAVTQANRDGTDMIFVGLYHTLHDDQGQYVLPETVIGWTGRQAQKPLFGFWDFSIGEGKAIGGLVLSGAEQGDVAADQVLAILDSGRPAQSLAPRTAERGEYVFSRSALRSSSLQLPQKIRDKTRWLLITEQPGTDARTDNSALPATPEPPRSA